MEITQSPSKLKTEGLNLPPAGIQALEAFEHWCAAQQSENIETGGLPIRGRNYAALVTLNRLRKNYNLEQRTHKTPSGKQVKHQTNHHVSNVLQKFGEERNPLSEAGRTTRGSSEAVDDLLDRLKETDLEDLSHQERHTILTHMMNHCVWVESQYQDR